VASEKGNSHDCGDKKAHVSFEEYVVGWWARFGMKKGWVVSLAFISGQNVILVLARSPRAFCLSYKSMMVSGYDECNVVILTRLVTGAPITPMLFNSSMRKFARD
jgi:hypothetical protein